MKGSLGPNDKCSVKAMGGALAAILGALVSACSTQPEQATQPTAHQTPLDRAGPEPRLFFLCHGTSLENEESTRLQPTPVPGVFSLTYEVTDPVLVREGDTCQLDEARFDEGWGYWQKPYPLQVRSLEVPGSAAFSAEEEGGERLFTLRYPGPGRYRLVVDREDGFLSVTAEEATDPGSVVWSRVGQAFVTATGGIYGQVQVPRPGLSLLDPETGYPQWRHRFSSAFTFEPACARGSSVVVGADDSVVALAATDGTPQWSTDLAGRLSRPSSLECPPDRDLVYFTFGPSSRELVALDRTDGSTAWTFAGENPLFFDVTTEGTVMVSHNSASLLTTTTVLDAATGHELWSDESLSSSPPLDHRGGTFVLEGSTLSRVDSFSGRLTWSYHGLSGLRGYWLAPGRVLVMERDTLVALDLESGLVVWSWPFPTTDDAREPLLSVLAPDTVVIHTLDSSAVRSFLTALETTGGAVRWSCVLDGTDWSLAQDSVGRTFVTSHSTVARLSPENGELQWVFSPAPEAPGFAVFTVVGGDAQHVFVASGPVGEPAPPMGISALNAESGTLRWSKNFPSPISLLGLDESRIYLGYSGQVLAVTK